MASSASSWQHKGASLPAETDVEQTGSSSPDITPAHYFGVCILQFFGQMKPIVLLFFFSSPSPKTTEKGRSKCTFCLFAVGNACLGRRHCSEGQKYTETHSNSTTFSSAQSEPSALHSGPRGRGSIVQHRTCFPASNINRFLCVLFTVCRNLIFPNGPL